MQDVSVDRIRELAGRLGADESGGLAEYLLACEPAAALRLCAEDGDTTLGVYYSAYLWVLFAERDYVEIENIIERTKGTGVEKAAPFVWSAKLIEAAMELRASDVYSRKPCGEEVVDTIAEYAVEEGFRGVLYARIRDHYTAIDVARVAELLGISGDVVGVLNEKDHGWRLEGATLVPPKMVGEGDTKRAQLQDLVGLALHLESSNYV